MDTGWLDEGEGLMKLLDIGAHCIQPRYVVSVSSEWGEPGSRRYEVHMVNGMVVVPVANMNREDFLREVNNALCSWRDRE